MTRPQPKPFLYTVALVAIFILVIVPLSSDSSDSVLEQWQTMPSLPNGRVEVAAAADGQYIYVSGGGFGFPVFADVNSAAINPDGTLGEWAPTTPLPSERVAHASVVSADHLFVVGGYRRPFDPGGGQATVFAAPILEGGQIGEWHSTTPLPNDLYRHAAVTYGDWIYVIGGWRDGPPPGSSESKVYRATARPDGTVSGWVSLSPLPNTLHGHAAAVVNDRLFVIGGMAGLSQATMQSAVYSAPIHADGSLGPWNNVTPLPTPLHRMGVWTFGNHIVIGGGRTEPNGGDVDTVYVTTVDEAGTLSGWSPDVSLPKVLCCFGTASSNRYIYAINGGPAPSADVYKNTIELGAPPSATFGSPNSNPGVPFSAEPVNLATGNYVYQHQDLANPGRGLNLFVIRSYNSLDSYNGPLGKGWTHNYNMNLTVTPSGDVVVMTGDARRDIYTQNSNGTFAPPPGIYTSLLGNPDGSFTLLHKDQKRHEFNANGQLTSISDRNGNTQALTYDAAGNLSKITDTVGRFLTIAHDADGRITSIEDPIGRTFTYAYASSDDLVTATDPLGNASSYSYDASHRLASITDPLGNTIVTNTYDGLGRVSQQTDALGNVTTFTYDPLNRETKETDPLGRETIFTYNENFRLVIQEDALGGMVTYTYDANNNMTSSTDQNGHTTSFTYDGGGSITSTTDALGNVSTFTYDGRNNLLTRTDALGRTLTFDYDAIGNLAVAVDPLESVIGFAHDTFGQLVGITDANSNITAFSYDAGGNLASLTNPLGHTSSFAYDGVGRLIGMTDALGNTTRLAYDALDRQISTADPLGNTNAFAFDPNSNKTSETDANGAVTSFEYDALNHLLQVTDAEGGVVDFTYDEVGNRTSIIDTNGHVTIYNYDALDRLTLETNPLGLFTTYDYDPVGNRIARTDARGQLTVYSYDAIDRLTRIDYSDGISVHYAYNPVGNRLSMTDSNGTTTYSFDALNRLTGVTSPGGQTVAYEYDAVGNRTAVTYPDGKVASYTYDASNQLKTATDWAGHKTSYSYDADSILTRIAYPSGAAIDFTYDAADRLVEIVNIGHTGPFSRFYYTLDAVGNRTSVMGILGETTSYDYDALYRLIAVNSPGLTETYTYDPMGNRLTRVSNGSTTQYTYADADHLVQIEEGRKITLFDYDENGNLIQKEERVRQQSKIASYVYNTADRLVEASGRFSTMGFAYDGDGKRIRVTKGDDRFDYLWDVNALLPVVLTESGPEGEIDFLYGPSLISATGVDFLNYYQYDGLGSVIGLTNLDGQVQKTYTYDVWGNPTNPSDLPGDENKFAFTGQQWDAGTALLYLRARYYDPTTGRFLTSDPVPGLPVASQLLHRYVYARNNPLMFIDPSGEIPILVPLAIVGGGIVVGKVALEVRDFLNTANESFERAEMLGETDITDPRFMELYRQNRMDVVDVGKSGVRVACTVPGTTCSGPPTNPFNPISLIGAGAKGIITFIWDPFSGGGSAQVRSSVVLTAPK